MPRAKTRAINTLLIFKYDIVRSDVWFRQICISCPVIPRLDRGIYSKASCIAYIDPVVQASGRQALPYFSLHQMVRAERVSGVKGVLFKHFDLLAASLDRILGGGAISGHSS